MNEIDDNKLIELLNEIDNFNVEFISKNSDIPITSLTALILSRLVLINEETKTTNEFNDLLKYILSRENVTESIESKNTILH